MGEPAAGKSTFVAALLNIGGWRKVPQDKPFGHTILCGADGRIAGSYLGVMRPNFPGTDALSMSVAPKVLAWLDVSAPGRFVVGEGDRLGTKSFLTTAASFIEVVLVWVQCDADIAAQRRSARGWKPDGRWLKGRITKVRNLVDEWPGHRVVIDGCGDAEMQAHDVLERIR